MLLFIGCMLLTNQSVHSKLSLMYNNSNDDDDDDEIMIVILILKSILYTISISVPRHCKVLFC